MSIVMKSPSPRGELRVTAPVVAVEPTKPTGVSRRAVLNVLETFFRQPLLHLLPLILLAGLGLFRGLSAEDQYRSVGMLNATSGTLLADLTNGASRSFGYETPAAVTSRNVNDVLGTEQFLNDIIDRARVRGAIESGGLTRDVIRASVSAYPRGDNLVVISSTTGSAELSQVLAQAVSDGFINYVVQNDMGDQQVRVNTYTQQLEDYRVRLIDATDAYEEYMTAHEIADEDDRPFVERLAIERLQQDVERATEAFLDAQAKLDEAQLGADVAQTVVARQLRVVDVPNLPTAPLPNRREAAMTFVMFTMLGAVLSFGFVVARALLDRTVRGPDEIAPRFGMDVLAVVPQGRRR